MQWLLSAAALLVALYKVTAASSLQEALDAKAGTRKPNIVFILTDDQDLHLNSLDFMPNVQKQLIEKGSLYERHYATIALCCPSRVSLWTGRAAHNTNVTDVNPPYGGYPKFVSQGFNEAWLPLWLQDAGYNTYYTGKLFNAHTVANYDSPFPSGFNGSDFLLDPYTYQYLNATFQHNQDKPVSHEGEYSTDVLTSKAYGLLDEAIAAAVDRPFFVTVAPNAPHSNVEFTEDWVNIDGESVASAIKTTPPVPAARHAHLFPDAIVPRTPNFNPDFPTGVSWISRLPKQSEANVEANDHFYRNRLRALQAVDELVAGIIDRLSAAGLLDNTYIFYSSDNGFHIGQHRMQPGKECGFEEDINVPLIVRGPGVAEGVISETVTTHTDLAPTFLKLAGGGIRDDFDGSAIDIHAGVDAGKGKHGESAIKSEHVNVEFWGFALAEGEYDARRFWNNTYKALRIVGNDYNLYYSVWCSGEHQLYDLTVSASSLSYLPAHPIQGINQFFMGQNDAYELHNLYPSHAHDQNEPPVFFRFTPSSRSSSRSSPSPSKTIQLRHLITRLDSLLLVLKSCKSQSCTDPWRALHPDGSVSDLHGALAGEFDDFYETQQQRVAFSRCERGYLLDAEGPIDVKAFGKPGPAILEDYTFLSQPQPRGGRGWSELV
ncbi:hypothetical protein DV737_g5387, partial [Chaetothyriales sp. CBS 132003]